jgi:hypothetical protein
MVPLYRQATLIGLELELETTMIHSSRASVHLSECGSGLWVVDHEGSLRRGGFELKYSAPQRASRAYESLCTLMPILYDSTGTWRAAVHCHVNIKNQPNLHTIFALAYACDRGMFEVTSPERMESNFCSPLVNHASEAQVQYRMFQASGDTLPEFGKYRSLNIQAMHSFGSFEFRHMKMPELYESVPYTTAQLKRIANFSAYAANIVSIGGEYGSITALAKDLVNIDTGLVQYLPPITQSDLTTMLQADTDGGALCNASGHAVTLAQASPAPFRRRRQSPVERLEPQVLVEDTEHTEVYVHFDQMVDAAEAAMDVYLDRRGE